MQRGLSSADPSQNVHSQSESSRVAAPVMGAKQSLSEHSAGGPIQAEGADSLRELQRVCESMRPQYTFSYSVVATDPWKVQVKVSGKTFETGEFFNACVRAARASAGLALQWLGAELAKGSQTTDKPHTRHEVSILSLETSARQH
jgi:hypothetical protein